MSDITITKGTRYFKIHKISARGRDAVEKFARKYIQYGLEKRRGGFVRAAMRVYAAATVDRREYRFHINQLKEFQEHLVRFQIPDSSVEFHSKDVPTPRKVELPVFPTWKDLEEQVPAIEYLVDDLRFDTKFLALQTGKGKSYCTMRAASIAGELPVFLMRPMYIEKWMIDIYKTYDIIPEDLLIVRGSSQLQALIHLAMNKEVTAKVIMISNKTIQNWIKLYEKIGDNTLDLGYDCRPDEFFEVLQAGIRVIDEAHLDFHLNFKIDLYTNIKKCISLSATLRSDDAFLNEMYEVAYPIAQRYRGPAYDKYIAALGIVYRLSRPTDIRFKEYGSTTYSHNVFEQSMLKSKAMLPNFINLINLIVINEFIETYKKGERCLLYGASIDFCAYLAAALQRLHPSLDVRRYCESDPYENLMLADICVSTVLSAGTNVDIPGLVTVIMTNALMSTQSNVQGFGRLRKSRDGSPRRFVWMTCEDIPKHLEYHDRKVELMNELAASSIVRYVGAPL